MRLPNAEKLIVLRKMFYDISVDVTAYTDSLSEFAFLQRVQIEGVITPISRVDATKKQQ